MGPNFHVSAQPTFASEFSSISERLNIKLVAISRSFSRVCSLILLIMDKYGFKVLYLEFVSLKGEEGREGEKGGGGSVNIIYIYKL